MPNETESSDRYLTGEECSAGEVVRVDLGGGEGVTTFDSGRISRKRLLGLVRWRVRWAQQRAVTIDYDDRIRPA